MNALNEYKEFLYERDKIAWEQTRTVAAMVINTAQAKAQDKRKMLKNLKFPWDDEEGESGLTKEEMERHKRIAKEKLEK